MPNPRTSLSARDREFILRQRLFFVSTAAPSGQVNLSPKGLDSLQVLAEDRILWLSLTGSGNETAAHLLETPRMTLMFCAFEGRPGILRVYGRAVAYHPRDPQWEELIGRFPEFPGSRQIFDLRIERVQSSCGTGVPLFDFRGERGEEQLLPFYAKMSSSEQKDYWHRKNSTSIDGRPTRILEG